MSFQLRPAHTASVELRRIARGKIEDCRQRLESVKSDPEGSVHALRKNFKRMRALYRLLNRTGNLFVPRELERFRNLGRLFAGARDAAVLEQSLMKLQFITNDESLIGHLEKLTERVQQRLGGAQPRSSPRIPRTRVLAELQQAEAQLLAAIPSDLTLSSLVRGYQQTYRIARKSFHMLPLSTNEEDWHDWRKHVKDDCYQTQLMSKLRSGKPRRRLSQLRELADLLGYDHDLSMLSELLTDTIRRPTDRDWDVLDLIDRQRRDLQRRCLALGGELYDEKASRVLNQFARALANLSKSE